MRELSRDSRDCCYAILVGVGIASEDRYKGVVVDAAMDIVLHDPSLGISLVVQHADVGSVGTRTLRSCRVEKLQHVWAGGVIHINNIVCSGNELRYIKILLNIVGSLAVHVQNCRESLIGTDL